jgi:biopolymer transport protein ExbB
MRRSRPLSDVFRRLAWGLAAAVLFLLPVAGATVMGQGNADGKSNVTSSERAASDSADAEPASDTPARKGPVAKGFFEILFSGGIVGVIIMVALLSLSFLAVALIVDNGAFTLRRDKVLPPGLVEQVKQLATAGRYPEAERMCEAKPSFLANVLKRGLGEAEYGWAECEKALEEGLAEQTAGLFRKVEYLSVIGNLAPMLGLLGTVTGMLMAFQEVALSEGSAGAAELAEGIYQALVTTVVGLIIAIPALGAFAVYRNRVDQLAAEGAGLALAALSPVKKRSILAPVSSPAPVPSGGNAPPPPPPRKPQ